MDPQNSSRSSNCTSRLEILQQFENEINVTRRTAFENLIRKYESVPENSKSAVINFKSMTVEKGRVKAKPFGKLSTYKGMSSKAKKLLKELKANLSDSSGYDNFIGDSQYLMNKLTGQSSSNSVVRACININETLVLETSSVHGCDLNSSMNETIDSNETLKDSYVMNDTTINDNGTPKNSPCRAIDTATFSENHDPSICDLSLSRRHESKGKIITPIRVTNQREPCKTLDISRDKLVDSSNDVENLTLVELEPKKTAYQRKNNLNCPRSGELVSPNRIGIEQDRLGKGVSPGMCDRFSAISIGLGLRNGKMITPVKNDGNEIKSKQKDGFGKSSALWISESNQEGENDGNEMLAISKFSQGHIINVNKKLEIRYPEILGNSHKLKDNLFEFLAKRTGSKCLSNNLPPPRKGTIFKQGRVGEDICMISQLTSPKHKDFFSKNMSLRSAINNETFGSAMADDCSTLNSNINTSKLKFKHNVSMELKIVCTPLSSEDVNKFQDSKTVCNNTDNKAEERSSLISSHFGSSLDGHLDESICNKELEPTSDVTVNADPFPAVTRHYLRHSTFRRNSEFLLNKNAVSSPKDMGKSSTSKKRLEYSPIATESSDSWVEKNNCNESSVTSNSTSLHESGFNSPGICHRFNEMNLMHFWGNSPKTISSKVANQTDIEEIGIVNSLQKKSNTLKHKQLFKYSSKSDSNSNEIISDNLPSENSFDNESAKKVAKSQEILPDRSGFLSQPRNDKRKRKADYEKVNSMTNKCFIQESTIHAISPNPCVAPQNGNVLQDSLLLQEKANEMSPSGLSHSSNMTPMRNKMLLAKSSQTRSVPNSDGSDRADFSSCSTDVSTNIGNRHLIKMTYRPKSSHKKYTSVKSANNKTSSSDDNKNSRSVHHSGLDQTEKIPISNCVKNCETFNYQSPKAECNSAMKTLRRKKLDFYNPKTFQGFFPTLSPNVRDSNSGT